MTNEVSFRIKIQESGEMLKVSANADELASALDKVQKGVREFNSKTINSAQIAQAIDTAQRSIIELQSKMTSLSAAYAAQEAVESKLQTVMRNTMGATDEEIQSILDLASAQQKLGVIGDEVQLAGAQELATYLSKTETLKKLIPVLNDMTAQQYGLEASQESCAQIATMLGKVMEGQTSALSRYGYSFTEAQEKILKFGTEEERAATLAEVVSASVGGVNAELAKTDSGKLKQVNNTLGDMAEKLGKVATAAMPIVVVGSQALMAAANVGKLVAGINALGIASTKLATTTRAIVSLNSALLLTSRTSAKSVAAMRRLITATGSAAAATKALHVAKFGLIGVMGALTIAVVAIAKKYKESKRAAEGLSESQAELRSQVADARAEMELDILKLSSFSGSQQEAAKMVETLNEKYGDRLGMRDSISAWYDTLSGKIDIYCAKLAKEAQLQQIINDTANNRLKRDQLAEDIKTISPTMTRTVGGMGVTYTETVPNLEYVKMSEEISSLDTAIEQGAKRAEAIMKELASVSDELGAGLEAVTESGKGADKSVEGLSKAIDDYRTSVERAVELNRIFSDGRDDMTVRLDAMRSGISSLVRSYGLEDTRIQELIDSYWNLVRARDTALGELPTVLPAPILRGRAQTDTTSGLAGFRNTSSPLLDEAIPQPNRVNETSAAIYGLSSAFRELGGIMDETAQTWLNWGANVASAIASAIEPIVRLIALLSTKKALTDADTQAEASNAATTVAASNARAAAKTNEATANAAAAVSGAGSSVASIPFAGPVMAVAAIASVVAALAKIPKFASGGIAYGPTLGIFGEYAGASTNPEVVAPLDKLKGMLVADSSGAVLGGEVELKLRGRNLVGVLSRENNLKRRS